MDELTGERIAEIDKLFVEFKGGLHLADPYTNVIWEFLRELPDGVIEIRKTSAHNGNRTKKVWQPWQIQFELNRIIESRLRNEVRALVARFQPLNALKEAIWHYRNKGEIKPGMEDYGPLIAAIAGSDDPNFQQWLGSYHDDEKRLMELVGNYRGSERLKAISDHFKKE